jgi:hypothetical protein
MTFIDHGFLSSEMAEFRVKALAKYRDYTTLLAELNHQLVAVQYELKFDLSNTAHVLAASYFVRTLASTQASAILLEHALISQSQAVLRSALESLFALAALDANPDIAVRLAQSQATDKCSLADKMLRWKSDELKLTRDAHIPESELTEFATNKAASLNTYSLAEFAGMSDWYLSLYALLSQAAHNTVSDLATHMVRDRNGSVIELQNEPLLEGQDSAWVFIIEVQLRAAKAVANLFAGTSIDVETYELRLKGLIERAANGSRT